MRRSNSILLLLLLAFASCTEDLSIQNGQRDREITFSAQLGVSTAGVRTGAGEARIISLKPL